MPVYDNDGVFPHWQEKPAELPSEGGAVLPTKKRRREGADARKKRRRQQGGLCQLNLDELYIVCGFPFVMFPPSVDRMIMIDLCIHLSYGPPEPCTYLQASPRHLDAQIVSVSLEERPPPSRGPA